MKIDTKAFEELCMEYVREVAAEEVKKEADKIFNEISITAEFAIANFYSSYDPTYYKRTYVFYTIYDVYKEPGKMVNGVPSYNVGINIHPSAASGHKDPNEYVYNGVMNMGVHGETKIHKSTPPMEMIHAYFDQFK